ncbi:lysophospholipid acyltransferase family protein [Maribacter polysiphoniae]|uniref:KDO2-lipid IV(A) lauroyltransferase n=1 Tax=Maribacter polysiphoniae TaxID=429344 RepID=A0A316DZ79_9FLAO|nr:lysophospholipid acyltransferase family protein [Maribacter polysiphoniae]MBD1261334.1 lysophospholipid acyltransferase family protein [Maribacter polysiphoniae]PWK23424.1 KDO2-lipid IV(A) lauroyltransferase [Maribacter polysiphoniae]
MQLLAFILTYPLLWVISILPHRLFYGFSDFMFFLVYRVVGYRKKVVRGNLELVFPDKSKEELKAIEKDFYHHMCDMFLEMVKGMNLSKEAFKRKYNVTNIEVLHEIEKEKSILLVCAHYANWEWNVSLSNYTASKGYAVYQKISNPYFDKLVKKIRAKHHTSLITQKETVKTVIQNHQDKVRAIYGMVSDQSPQAQRAHYWKEFMGVKVPVFNGAETLARKLDLAVVFLKVSKVKRGYYNAEFIPITTAGSNTAKNEITDKFLTLTEQQIKERPELYFWTHRRWKHRDKAPK